MTYQVGGVTVEGDQPSNVIVLAFGKKVTDGGRARITRRRTQCDLTMDHVDNGMPSDVAYHAPETDPA
jgi:hypothetical protein